MKFLDIYHEPLVSRTMSPRFQRIEVILPLILAVGFAIAGTTPLFSAGRWLTGIACVVIWTLLLYTLHAALLRMRAERQPDGNLYIPPSVASSRRFISVGLSAALSVLYMVILMAILRSFDT